MLYRVEYRNGVTGLLHSSYNVDAGDEDAAKGVAAKQFNADLVRDGGQASYNHQNFGVSVSEVPEATDVLTEENTSDEDEGVVA